MTFQWFFSLYKAIRAK